MDLTLDPFQVDHIISRQHGGPTALHNLALSCYRCNKHKGPNLTGIDPDTGFIADLFHPRNQSWHDHFGRNGAEILGRTMSGRATVRVLTMNDPDRLKLRTELLNEGAMNMTDAN